jgi:hypothetical protein
MSIVPGLGGLLGSANAGVGSFYLHLTTNQFDVNVWERMGSPSGIIYGAIVEIDPGVEINSSSFDQPGIDFSGFAIGTKVLLVMVGADVNGRGGNGGVGEVKNNGFYGGGGGGGGGWAPGIGGLAGDAPGSDNTATDGQNGTTTGLGGDGGQSDVQGLEAPPPSPAVGGDDGGDAIYMGTTDLDIDAGGAEGANIWSGGGGGAGGARDLPATADGFPGAAAGNGADSWFGTAGGTYPTGGPGYAIRYTTGILSFIGDPLDSTHLRGPVGDGT